MSALSQRSYSDTERAAATAALELLAYCRANRWQGYDPYDALNSRLFNATPLAKLKLARLILTQGVKRSPINFRPLLLIPKAHNPKGLALFLSALLKLKRCRITEDTDTILTMVEHLQILRSPGTEYCCWGYHFDWQTRTDLVPKHSPNIICTTFAANALLDAFEQLSNPAWLTAAESSAKFIIDRLLWSRGASGVCFSYTPTGRTEIHNANLLGAALIARVSRLTGKSHYLSIALEAARYSVERQRADGSWHYGESPAQHWIDNFHTGFNLVALHRIREYAETREFDQAIRKGYDFYLGHFFRRDGAPKYFHDSVYPVDIHSIAQSIITLVELADDMGGTGPLVDSIVKWGLVHMRDPRGFYYFQKHRFFTVRTSFMRWSQAWMLMAYSTLLDNKLNK